MKTIFRTAAALAALAAAGVAAAQPAGLLDPAEGHIDGEIAIAAVPLDERGAPALPLGFRVHLIPETDPDVELTFPAGQWFQPPKGRYKLWLEGMGTIAPAPMVLNYSGSRFEGRGMLLALPTVAAGTVRLPAPPEEDDRVLRLLHLDSHVRDGVLARELSKRVSGAAAAEGVQMPAGQVIGALFDNGSGRYVALTHPAEVTPGRVTTLLPAPPSRGMSDLVAVLERPWRRENAREPQVEAYVQIEGAEPRPPDVLVVTVERVYAVWYDLPSGQAEVRASTAVAELPATTLALSSGQVESLRTAMVPLPSLQVSLDLPPELMTLDPKIDVRPVRRLGGLAERRVDEPRSSFRFQTLPREEVEVRLTAGPWTFREAVDLATGPRHEVVFRPWPIHVHGTVYVGDTPVGTAEIAFQVGRKEQRVSTASDEDGDYELTLFRPGRHIVAVTLPGRGVPHYRRLQEPIEVSGRLDFHLPDNSVRVEVLDDPSSAPISGARVAVKSRKRSERPSGVALNLTTGEDGSVVLPPLDAGDLTIEVVAEGYESERVEEIEVPSRPGFERELVVRMKPEGSLWTLRVLDPRELPAVDADVAAVAPEDGQLFWTGRTDTAGEVRLPREVAGALLLVRHGGAGLIARRWIARGDEEAVVWQLPTAAADLFVRTVDDSGSSRPFCGIAIEVGGHRLTGVALAWITGTTGATDRHGLWRISNVPAGQPVALQALSGGDAPRASRGDRVVLSPPWPQVVELSSR